MPTTHFARTVFKGGRSGAVQRVHYITRTEPGRAEVQVRYQGFVEGTDQQREDLVYWRARNLPPWAHDNPVVFFRAAEQYGSAYQTAYEEWKFSLPRELSRTDQLDAASDFLKGTFGEKHPYVWAMHDPVAADGGRQPHVHVLWSSRTIDGLVRTPEQFFRRYNAAYPERGGAAKARAFSHFGTVKAARVHYTDVMNLHLERAGAETRLHPDRLEGRGIRRKPEPRLSPADSQALKQGGVITKKMQRVMDHRAVHATAKALERRVARTYWDARRQELGLTQEQTTGQHLTRIREAWVCTAREVPEHPQRFRVALGQHGMSRGRESIVADHERTMRLTVPLVGNRVSKIFHSPSDPSYGVVAPDKQVVFWSRAAAEEAGYRAARNQHYGRGSVQRREFVEAEAPQYRYGSIDVPRHDRGRGRSLAWGHDVADVAHGGVQVRMERGMERER